MKTFLLILAIGSALCVDAATITKWNNLNVGGGSSAFRVQDTVITNEAPVVLNLSDYDVFKLKILTNYSLKFTNTADLTSKAYVYYQQDTNGGWSNLLTSVHGGLIQTNAYLQATTNANALDLLEVVPGFFTTNLMAYWPQNFQPRVPFLDTIGGGGGGGDPQWFDVETVGNTDTDAGTSVDATEWSPITLGAGDATKGRIWFQTCAGSGSFKMGLYSNDGNTLLASGEVSYTTADDAVFKEITFDTPATVSAGSYLIAWSFSTVDPGIRRKAGVGNWKSKLSHPYANFPTATLPSPDFDLARNYAVSVYVE